MDYLSLSWYCWQNIMRLFLLRVLPMVKVFKDNTFLFLYTYYSLYMACVGPGHCYYRIGPICFLAGWRKRRPEPGLVRFR